MSDYLTLNQFFEDINSDRSEIRLRAISKLPTIAKIIQPSKFTKEIVPFILNTVDEQEEANMLELINLVPSLISLTGKNRNSIKFIEIVELGLTSDFISVRSISQQIFKQILKGIISDSSQQKEEDFDYFESIRRLSTSNTDKHKIALISIMPFLFKYLKTSERNQLIKRYSSFTIEQCERVKVEVSKSLKDLSFFIEAQTFTIIVKNLMACVNDNIRIPIIEGLSSVKHHQDLIKLMPFINECVNQLFKDNSWRVRLVLADNLHNIISFDDIQKDLHSSCLRIFTELFKDDEAEIRNICVKRLPNIIEKINSNQEDVIQVLESLKFIKDEKVEFVNITLSSEIFRVISLVSQQIINEKIMPTIMNLLSDDQPINVQVNIIKNLGNIKSVTNVKYEDLVIKTIKKIYARKLWKKKIQIITTIPYLIKYIDIKSFIDEILSLILESVLDDVYCIREASVDALISAVIYYQSKELEKIIFGRLSFIIKSPRYLFRMTASLFIKNYIRTLYNCMEIKSDSAFLENQLFSLMEILVNDKSPNVRVQMAQALVLLDRQVNELGKSILESPSNGLNIKLNPKSQDALKRLINKLKSDQDFEVLIALNLE